MELVTVATQSKGFMPWLQASCQRHGAGLVVLGYGQRWQGFAWRYHLMLDYMATKSDDTIICFIDAYDVVLLRPLQELAAAFEALVGDEAAVVVSSPGVNTSAFTRLCIGLTMGRCQKKIVNPGSYIGRKKYLTQMIHTILGQGVRKDDDDMLLMTEYCNSKGAIPRVIIDSNNVFFLISYDNREFGGAGRFACNASDGSITSTLNGTRPFLLHMPGNGDMRPVLLKLGYVFSPQDNREIDAYRSVYMKQLIRHWYWRWMPVAMVVVIVATMIAILILSAVKGVRQKS